MSVGGEMTAKSLREAAVRWMADDPEEQHVAATRDHLEDEAWLFEHFAKPLDLVRQASEGNSAQAQPR